MEPPRPGQVGGGAEVPTPKGALRPQGLPRCAGPRMTLKPDMTDIFRNQNWQSFGKRGTVKKERG